MKCETTAQQTDMSHFRRDNDAQVTRRTLSYIPLTPIYLQCSITAFISSPPVAPVASTASICSVRPLTTHPTTQAMTPALTHSHIFIHPNDTPWLPGLRITGQRHDHEEGQGHQPPHRHHLHFGSAGETQPRRQDRLQIRLSHSKQQR